MRVTHLDKTTQNDWCAISGGLQFAMHLQLIVFIVFFKFSSSVVYAVCPVQTAVSACLCLLSSSYVAMHCASHLCTAAPLNK